VAGRDGHGVEERLRQRGEVELGRAGRHVRGEPQQAPAEPVGAGIAALDDLVRLQGVEDAVDRAARQRQGRRQAGDRGAAGFLLEGRQNPHHAVDGRDGVRAGLGLDLPVRHGCRFPH
jgi:hypothetical protein